MYLVITVILLDNLLIIRFDVHSHTHSVHNDSPYKAVRDMNTECHRPTVLSICQLGASKSIQPVKLSDGVVAWSVSYTHLTLPTNREV